LLSIVTGGAVQDEGDIPPITPRPLTMRSRPTFCDGHSLVGPVIVGVAGASGSGKTSLSSLVAQRLREMHLHEARIADISCDSYYRTKPAHIPAGAYNFDDPSALDLALLVEHLKDIKAGGAVIVPSYSFVTHARTPDDDATRIDGSATDVVIVDGIFVLHDPRVRALLDVSVFTSEDQDICLLRRLKRDLVERGRTVDSVIAQYLTFVRPGFEKYVRPSEAFADLIIPRAKSNSVAIGVLARELSRKVEARLLATDRGSEATSLPDDGVVVL
jgi:uridine kinase